MENNYMKTKEKIQRMKQLIDLYDQYDFINDEHTKKTVKEFINKQEEKLIYLLDGGK